MYHSHCSKLPDDRGFFTTAVFSQKAGTNQFQVFWTLYSTCWATLDSSIKDMSDLSRSLLRYLQTLKPFVILLFYSHLSFVENKWSSTPASLPEASCLRLWGWDHSMKLRKIYQVKIERDPFGHLLPLDGALDLDQGQRVDLLHRRQVTSGSGPDRCLEVIRT